jgi:hypothetical protein
MTHDDIIKMAKEADLWLTSDERLAAVVRFAELVAAAEREACAKVAERYEPDEKTSYVTYASSAIRARGEK